MGTISDLTPLLTSSATEVAHIELTSRCTLRCVYCAVSQPGYQGVDLDLDLACIDEVLNTLEDRRTSLIYVNGHGETTMVKDWDAVCDRMLDRGMRLSVVSNFARKFTDKELNTLSRFAQICVSCDTIDPELFAALRPKAKLSMLLENMARVRERSRQARTEGPRFSWSIVVSDKTVLGLEELVRRGLDLGVRHFEFCNLTKYPDLPNRIAVRHISTMTPGEMQEARRSIKSALKLADQKGSTWSIQSGLLDALDEQLNSIAAPVQPSAEPVTRYSAEAGTGMTRLCLDPWKMLYVHADGNVRTCCWHWEGMGNLKAGDTLAEIANNSKMQALRRQLLTGELGHFCQSCPARPLAPIESQRAAVMQLFDEQQAAPPGAIRRWRQLRQLRKTITLPLLSITKTVRRWKT